MNAVEIEEAVSELAGQPWPWLTALKAVIPVPENGSRIERDEP